MSDNMMLPEVIRNWVEDINNRSTRIWLREIYAIKLQSLNLFLGKELEKFKKELQIENRKASKKAIRKR